MIIHKGCTITTCIYLITYNLQLINGNKLLLPHVWYTTLKLIVDCGKHWIIVHPFTVWKSWISKRPLYSIQATPTAPTEPGRHMQRKRKHAHSYFLFALQTAAHKTRASQCLLKERYRMESREHTALIRIERSPCCPTQHGHAGGQTMTQLDTTDY